MAFIVLSLVFFFTDTVLHNFHQHWVEDYIALACKAGGIKRSELPQVFLLPEERSWAEEEIKRYALRDTSFLLGCHVGASYLEKSWRPERILELAKVANQHCGAKLLAFGGQREKHIGAWLAAQNECIIDFTGRLSLRQFMALASYCHAFVGGDSGPTHIAAALGVPTVGLYGFSDPKRTCPLGVKVKVLIKSSNWDTRNKRRQISPYQWLDSISAEEVWDALCSLIES
jgi:ADP-heptose:LPS heptosyltransferase